MHVVWISSHHPALGEGGAAAHEFELIRSLADRHRIHVICAGLEPRAFPDLAAIGVTVDHVVWKETPRPRNRLGAYWRLAMKDAGTTLWRVGNKIELLGRALRRYEAQHRIDVVNVVMGDIAPVVRYTDAPTALLLFDVFTRHGERRLDATASIRERVVKTGHLRSIRRWEQEWYPRASALACVAEPDAEALTRLVSRRVEVIPNPIADDFFVGGTEERSSDIVAFIATLDYEPNIDGLRWLIGEVWPLVLARRPDARLQVVGWKPDDDVREMCERVGASLHPNVPDVRPFYRTAAVTVAPMHLGAGLRNKILHAMACRAPIVTTSAAVEGIGVSDGEHLLVRDAADGFADGIVSVLDDPIGAQRRCDVAFERAQQFAATAVGERLERWWELTAQRPSGRPVAGGAGGLSDG